MLNSYKMIAIILMSSFMLGRAAMAGTYGDGIYYTFRVRGDDALTQSLTNALEGENIGFHFVPIDKADSTTIVVFLTDHLEIIPDPGGDQVKYRVEFYAAEELISSMSGQCPIEDIQKCKASILKRLQEVARGERG